MNIQFNGIIFLLALFVCNGYRVVDVVDSDLTYRYSSKYNAKVAIPFYYSNVKPNEFSEMLKYYSWFSSMGYCRDEWFTQGTCCPGILEDWEIIDHKENKGYNYVLLKSDKYQKFIYSFPGTRSFLELVRQVLNSILIDTFSNNRDNKSVKYFKNKADDIRNLAFSTNNIQEIAGNRGYQVIFTGHSLGGAVATIMSYYASYYNYINRSNNPTVLLTFGAPRSGNDVLATEIMKKVSVVYRIVRDGDMVSTIPPCFINLKGKCRTSLGITDEFKLNSNGIFDIFKNTYNYWHVGGLIVLNKAMNKIIFCNPYKAENYKDECKYTMSTNQDYHKYYFNNEKMSAKCKPKDAVLADD